MSHLDPGIDLGLNTDVFNHLLRLVRNRSLTQYLASHHTAYNELVAAVHDTPPPKPLLTPASTTPGSFVTSRFLIVTKSAGTAGSSTPSMASFGADDEHPMDGEAQFHSCVPQTTPQGQSYQAEETGGRPDPSISESLESQSAGSPAINLRPGEWQAMDLIEPVASRSSLAEPLSVMSVSEESPVDMASEDMSMDMYPYHDPSQPAFPAVLHGTPPTPTMEPGLGANYPTWNLNGGADTGFHDAVQLPNFDNIYLSSPIMSPTLPPWPQTTADDVVLHDQSYPYSAPFFLEVGSQLILSWHSLPKRLAGCLPRCHLVHNFWPIYQPLHGLCR